MSLALPTSNSPLRQLFDVADLAALASPSNRAQLPTFRQTVESAIPSAGDSKIPQARN